jgi:hypothetical protein
MQLLLPNGGLIGIAVEGLEPADQAKASADTVEVADLTLYYGRKADFQGADKVCITQFKYSVYAGNEPFRASHAKSTVTKFAASYRDHQTLYGAKSVRKKLQFELITNRPIYPALLEAITCLAAARTPPRGEIRSQAEQFKAASGLSGPLLQEFAGKCEFTGLAGSLAHTKKDLSSTLIDWSASRDATAAARLGEMRQLVRDKAGTKGQQRNVITQVDILAVLGLQDITDLLPCPVSLSNVGVVVEREQLLDAIKLVPKLDRPLLVHAAGGVGKTVFLQSLATSLSASYECVFFDCFGGGAYRAPDDPRHLPKRGLLHIINTLACRGLCDPIIPGNIDNESLWATFRRRLSQCVQTLSTASPDRELLLFIDAIDNAFEFASERNEQSFPTLLLESIERFGAIPHVRLVVSCRSHRKNCATGTRYTDFRLRPFSLAETTAFLVARIAHLSDAQIKVAQARSNGNARILEHLALSDRGLLEPSEIDKPILLDELIKERLNGALSEAVRHGYQEAEIRTFLAGLAVLPPPVPLIEYAAAHAMEVSAIESFAADLAPLLENTKHGLMFRDEPTETLIRETYVVDKFALRRLATNLLGHQDRSIYAARVLPDLLRRLDDDNQLFNLAFDDRFPASITSLVGRRHVRNARLKAAILQAATKKNNDHLVHLLLELSAIASVDQRGATYIFDNPDLVIAAHDVDAIRRLFETRPKWPGARHARLAVANVLAGDSDEGYRHAVRANDWIQHYLRQEQRNHDQASPDRLDIASIPFFLISQGQSTNAIGFLKIWKDWYAYEVGEHLFHLLQQANNSLPTPFDVSAFLEGLHNDPGCLTAALSFMELRNDQRVTLIQKLARSCTKNDFEFNPQSQTNRVYDLGDGLRRASAIAASFGLKTQSRAILNRVHQPRPNTWAFRDNFYHREVFPFLFYVATVSALNGKKARERDILPAKLALVASQVDKRLEGLAFKTALKEKLEESARVIRGAPSQEFSSEERREAHQFIARRLDPLLRVTNALAGLIRAKRGKAKVPFSSLLQEWAAARKSQVDYQPNTLDVFFQQLGCEVAIFALWVRDDLKPASVKAFLNCLHEQNILTATILTQIVGILATRKSLQSLAGEEALRVRPLIEQEHDVNGRAALWSSLARAILPASPEEASAYFRIGLEQMDAIGSGDMDFTNELLIVAASAKGNELGESAYHTLTNICELNMYDHGKFPWIPFSMGLARVAGVPLLAKLSRWHDRAQVPFSYTLLPYLTALLREKKIGPEDALVLNRLADPVELWGCNTATFAEALVEADCSDRLMVVKELIQQFQENNPGAGLDSTVQTLASTAAESLGRNDETTKYLLAAHGRFKRIREEQNEHMNYHPASRDWRTPNPTMTTAQRKKKLTKLARRTNPLDSESIALAIDSLKLIQSSYELSGELLAILRADVPFEKRSKYIETIACVQKLRIYSKFAELKKCKTEWGASSVSLSEIFRGLRRPILDMHKDEFISFGSVSEDLLRELEDLTGIPKWELAGELIKLFATDASNISSAVWLGLASSICGQATAGEGQAALTRLLESSAAKLTASVPDGPWKPNIYPPKDIPTIMSGVIWCQLGSPRASDRWRAAHSIRCLVKFRRWEVFDAIVGRYPSQSAHPFQAAELPFYYLHARLWLLIAIARVALDYPHEVGKYHEFFLRIALENQSHHVLLKHFAVLAIRACVSLGGLRLPSDVVSQLGTVNVSPYPRLAEKRRHGNDFYRGRPQSEPEPKYEFSLDYDFEKIQVQGLANIFGKPGWEIKDLIAEQAQVIDATISSMYQSGGRDCPERQYSRSMIPAYHEYGQYVGWHALMHAAGLMLLNQPVTDDSYDDEPWLEWLRRETLTRQDDLWLSDGMDRAPLRTQVNLLEKGPQGLVLTGDKKKLLALIGLSDAAKALVVNGHWYSPDRIYVRINSALVEPDHVSKAINDLLSEEPFSVYLPDYERPEDLNESVVGWTITPYGTDAKLDAEDPIGVIEVERRPQFADYITTKFSLESHDPFRRIWKDSDFPVARALAWATETSDSKRGGVMLACSPRFLRKLLHRCNSDLLVLIKLERYEERSTGEDKSRYFHTIGVVRVNKHLRCSYHAGTINHAHEMRF